VELADRSSDTVVPPSFGTSLREARIRRNISLEDIAAHTKINRSFLLDLERNDLSKWPRNQFYCESSLRAYSTAIGLDPREVIDGFRKEFVASSAPRPVPPSRNAHWLNPVTIPIILALTFVGAYSMARLFAPDSSAAETPAATAPAATTTATPAAPASGSRQVAPATSDAVAPKVEAPAPVSQAAMPPSNEAPPVETRVRGELSVDSTPPGARVLINGIARGSTPLVLQNLPPGSYTIRLILPGRPGVTRSASITTERPRASVSASLEPEPAPGPSLATSESPEEIPVAPN
jgi:transcriptional regulator with XRE-family HTH domain